MDTIERVAANFTRFLAIVKQFDCSALPFSLLFNAMRNMGCLYKEYSDICSIAEGEFDYYQEELVSIFNQQEDVIRLFTDC